MPLPPKYMEIENIYSKMQNSAIRSVAITSANAGEGVTSLAIALAQRYLLSGHATLVIDLNLHHPSFKAELTLQAMDPEPDSLGRPQLVSDASKNFSLMGITAPDDRATVFKLRKPGILEACLAASLERYDTVIIDTTPLNRCNGNNIPAERIAAACDAALLVVKAGETRQIDVNLAANRLQSAGAVLAGCIINDQINPPLKSELLRETQRLQRWFPWLARKLRRRIVGSHFLSIPE